MHYCAAKHLVVTLFDEFDAMTKDRGDSADHGEPSAP
jgi:hypothetical protein